MKINKKKLIVIAVSSIFITGIAVCLFSDNFKIKITGNYNYYTSINKLPHFNIEFSSKNLASLEGQISELLKIPRNIPYSGKKISVKGKINHNTQTIPISAKIHGMYADHWKEKYSLKILTKKNKTLLEMNGFILLRPVTRFFLSDWIAAEFEKKTEQLSLKRLFVSSSINSSTKKTYLVEESFKGLSKRLEDSILVFSYKVINDSVLIKPYNLNFNEKLKRKIEIELSAFISNSIENEILNLNDFGTYYAINDLCQGFHQLVEFNTHLYYNYKTKKISPIGREWNSLNYVGKFDKTLTINYLKKDSCHFPPSKLHYSLFNIQKFENIYFKKLELLSEIKLNKFFNERKDKIELYNKILWKDMGKLNYNFNYIYDNMEFISQSLK